MNNTLATKLPTSALPLPNGERAGVRGKFDDYRALIHSPNESATEYVQFAERIQQQPGITWGVPSLDRAIIPMRPGDVVGVIARPGHGKSTLAAYLARHTAKQLVAQDRAERECVVYVSFEQVTEEIEALFQANNCYSVTDLAWGRADLDQVRRAAVERMRLPIWLIGRSIERRRNIPRMTINNVYRALTDMEMQFKIKPSLIVLDYIQIIPLEHQAERIQQVSEAIMQTKELAPTIGCPMLICVQAARTVDARANKIPTAADCQWASAIEQTCDKLLGIWRPVLTEQPGDQLKLGAKTISLTEQTLKRLFIARLQKQRMAEAGQTFVLHFAPEYVHLADMELNSNQNNAF